MSGLENIPRSGGFILVSNHVSYFDPVVLGVACPRKVSYMARHDLFEAPVMNWLLPLLRTIKLKRGSADISALKIAIREVKANFGIILFPEGTRSADGQIKDPRAGVGFLMSKTQAPVVPAFITGSNLVLPKGAKFIKFAKIKVIFGKQLVSDPALSYEENAQRVMREIKDIASVSNA